MKKGLFFEKIKFITFYQGWQKERGMNYQTWTKQDYPPDTADIKHNKETLEPALNAWVWQLTSFLGQPTSISKWKQMGRTFEHSTHK